MHPALRIKDRLQKLNKTMNAIVTKELAGIGLTFPQVAVLKQTSDGEKTIGQISQAVGLSYSTVSGIIDRLEKSGYVERIRSNEDRRVIWIRHTAKVAEVKKLIPVFQDNYYINLLQDLSENELLTIDAALLTLNSHLEKKAEEKP